MTRRTMWISFFAVCFFFTCLGCAAVTRSISNYKACVGDQECMAEMSKVKESSYVVAKAASSNIPLPSVAEIIAVVVSNALSFGYGVFHGKKKG
jgi:SNF family Na+-dependent transporter